MAGESDFKSELQQELQAKGRPAPDYETVGQSGPPHAPVFTAAVLLEGILRREREFVGAELEESRMYAPIGPSTCEVD